MPPQLDEEEKDAQPVVPRGELPPFLEWLEERVSQDENVLKRRLAGMTFLDIYTHLAALTEDKEAEFEAWLSCMMRHVTNGATIWEPRYVARAGWKVKYGTEGSKRIKFALAARRCIERAHGKLVKSWRGLMDQYGKEYEELLDTRLEGARLRLERLAVDRIRNTMFTGVQVKDSQGWCIRFSFNPEDVHRVTAAMPRLMLSDLPGLRLLEEEKEEKEEKREH